MKRWLYTPRIELVKLSPVDFFPPKPATLEGFPYICIGTKTRTIGDALMLSTLPAKIRAKYPSVKVYTYPRGFNPVVFAGSPHVSGVRYLPRKLYGDDTNWGEGHLIQLKERFFEVPVSEHPKPEIHLFESEARWGKRLAEGSASPICVIHPWGHTWSVATPHFGTRGRRSRRSARPVFSSA